MIRMKKTDSEGSNNLREAPLVDEKEIFSDLSLRKGTSLLLGRYSLSEVIVVLSKKNFFREARKRELWPLDYNLDSSEFPLQRFQIFYREKKPENLIVDLKIKEGTFRPKNTEILGSSEFDFLIFEWLTLQNPLLSFSEKKPALPGQEHPGLGLGKKVLDIFVYLARLTKKDGLLAFPAYFHNALLFSRYFHFLNPEKQGEILALRKSFPQVSFKQLAWIVYLNCLRWKNNKIYEWKAEEQINPLNKTLKAYFDSKYYKKKVKQIKEKLQFTIDWECLRKKASSIDEEAKQC